MTDAAIDPLNLNPRPDAAPDPVELIKRYLDRQHMLQLATVRGGQPWCCTVYYVADDDYNIYWASLPERRHSREIADHPPVAAAVPVAFVNGRPVAGIQLAGTAAEVSFGAAPSPALRAVAERYAATFHRDAAWVDDFLAARTAHRLYKLIPASYVLFDEANFPAASARWEFTRL